MIARYPLATFVPAAVVGPIGEIPAYLIEARSWLDFVLTIVGTYFAYYLYLVYAEGLVYDAERGALRVGLRGLDERNCSGRWATSRASSWPRRSPS